MCSAAFLFKISQVIIAFHTLFKMRSQAKEYHLVDGNDSSPLVSEDPDSTHSIGSLYFSSTSSSSSIFDKALWCSVTLLVISLVFNLMFTLNYYQFKPHGNSLAPSEYGM